MIQIDKIEIKHFRSINRVRVDTSKDVIILSGRNDVGKSNVLKAMNLFFNDETDWRTPLHFTNDFSQTRLQEVRKKTIKGRQFIQVSIRFIRGDHYQKSLPDKFTVTRTWYRDTARQETNSLKTSQDAGKLPTKSLSRANAALQRYLHQIKFEYVPAIKDKLFFSYLLGAIQDVIVERKPGESALADNITSLNDLIKAETELLQQEFTRVSGISASINMPEGLDALFRAANVRTNRGELLVPLDLRGDGIRSRFLPSLLNYIAQSSKLSYIWGFEEPENSLEYLRTSELADKIVTEYAGNAQIFITSHSPSFFSRQDKNVAVYRVFSNNTDTDLFPVFPPQKNTNVTLTALENELGLMEFQKKYHEQFEKRINALAKQEEIHKELELKLQDLKMPVLVTEGKWDVCILEEAWRKVYSGKQCPFKILPCDPDGGDDGGAGGSTQLRKFLSSVGLDGKFIGLFDRDKQGCTDFALDKNFKGTGDVKIRKNGKTAAIILPAISSRKNYATVKNLVLEFYFEDSALDKTVEGKRLQLVFPKVKKTIDNLEFYTEEPSKELHTRKIKSETKKWFAEKVVPSLAAGSFKNFKPLFELIIKTFSELKSKGAH